VLGPTVKFSGNYPYIPWRSFHSGQGYCQARSRRRRWPERPSFTIALAGMTIGSGCNLSIAAITPVSVWGRRSIAHESYSEAVSVSEVRAHCIHGPFPSAFNLTYGRRSLRLHQNPACGGQGLRRARPFSFSAFQAMGILGSSTRIRQDRSGPGRFEKLLSFRRQAAFITAPSMMTPAVTYFHSATSSFRANATIITFFMRPPLRLTRSLNHRARADFG
jgi:hypothetical protein